MMGVIITYRPQQEDYWLGKCVSCEQTATHKHTQMTAITLSAVCLSLAQ